MAQTSNQVKFYAVNTLPASPEQYNLYFVNGGELYKGTQRFGLARVTDISSLNNDETVVPENLQDKINALAPNAARGDLAYGYGAAKVYNGSAWVDLGADSTITDDLTSRVEAIESHVIVNQNLISATTGSFTNLTADSATFTATSLNATSMIVGGKTIDQIANERIAAIPASTVTASNNGIEVGVTTQSGMVTAVTVNAAAFANVMHFKGVVNESSSGAPNLSGAIGDVILIGSEANIGWYNIGTGESPATGELTPGEKEGTGYTPATVGQEYVCVDVDQDGHCRWELIGDQNTGATKGYVGAAIASALAYASNTGIASNATTLNAAAQAAINAVDEKVTSFAEGEYTDADANKLVTAGAVKNLFDNIDLGTAAYANVLTFENGETWASATKSQSDELPTASQVLDLVTNGGVITAATVTYTPLEGAGVTSEATTVSEAINVLDTVVASAIADISAINTSLASLGTAAQKNYANTLTADGNSLPTEIAVATYVSGEIANLDASPTDAGTQGVSVAVVEEDGVITGVTTTVTKATLNTTLGTTNVADKTIATSIGATGVDTALATEKAVRDAIEAARTEFQLVWYDDEDANTGNGGEESGTEGGTENP